MERQKEYSAMASAHTDIKQKLEAALGDLAKLDAKIQTMKEDGDKSRSSLIEFLRNRSDVV